MGCPIRESTDQRLLTTPRGISQPSTPFFGSQRQGIHRAPLIAQHRAKRRAEPTGSSSISHHRLDRHTPHSPQTPLGDWGSFDHVPVKLMSVTLYALVKVRGSRPIQARCRNRAGQQKTDPPDVGSATGLSLAGYPTIGRSSYVRAVRMFVSLAPWMLARFRRPDQYSASRFPTATTRRC